MNATSKSTETKPAPELVIMVKGESRKIALDTTPGKSIIIGRDEACEISLSAAAGLSRQHCKITVEDNVFVIQDLGSTNGTYADEEEVKQSTPLKEGITYMIGDVTFQITGIEQQTVENREETAKDCLVIVKRRPLSTFFTYIWNILNPITNNASNQGVCIMELVYLLLFAFYVGIALYSHAHGGSLLPPFLD